MTGSPLTRAVILAAGRGTRLGALTEECPKPLLEVGGRPVIVRILEGLAAAGITDVTIVTGHLAPLVEAELGNGGQSGVRIRYVRQQALDGTARALALARDWTRDEPFFFSWGDILVRPENYLRVVRQARFADAVIAVNEVDDPSAGAAVYLEGGGLALGAQHSAPITRIVEKPAPGTSTTRWNNAGFGVIGPAIWTIIDRLEPSTRGEYELPQAIAALVESAARVLAVPVEGPWFDVGTPEALEQARAEFGHRRRA